MCFVGILLYRVLGHLLQVAIRITVYRAAVLRVPRAKPEWHSGETNKTLYKSLKWVKAYCSVSV